MYCVAAVSGEKARSSRTCPNGGPLPSLMVQLELALAYVGFTAVKAVVRQTRVQNQQLNYGEVSGTRSTVCLIFLRVFLVGNLRGCELRACRVAQVRMSGIDA